MKPLASLLLSAGQGMRLRPLTCHKPKPLLQVGGKPLLQWHLQALQRAGARQVVINICWLAEQFAPLREAAPAGLDIQWSQQSRLYGTAGDIVHALPLLLQEQTRPFAVINSDIFTEYPRERLLQPAQLPDGEDTLAHMVLVPTPATMKGDCDLVDGRIRPVPAPKGSAKRPWVFSGLSLLHPRLLEEYGRKAPEPFELWQHALQPAAEAGRVSGEIWRGFWTDAGTHQRLAELRAQMDSRGESRQTLMRHGQASSTGDERA